MGGDSYPNGRNGSIQITFSTQTLIDRIVENRIEQGDSSWNPSESAGAIRSQIFQEARNNYERTHSQYDRFPVPADHNYVVENGHGGQGGGHGGQTQSAFSPVNMYRNSMRGSAHVPGDMNGSWRPSNFYDSWNLRSVSPSVELMRMFGSQTINGGSISITRVPRNSQSSPINLSMNRDESGRNSNDRVEVMQSDGDMGDMSVIPRTEEKENSSERRRSSDENGESSSTSHWKKIMVSNINQQME